MNTPAGNPENTPADAPAGSPANTPAGAPAGAPSGNRSATINAAVLGVGGYAGGELIRLLLRHPAVKLKTLAARASGDWETIAPQLASFGLPRPQRLDRLDWDGIDVAFSCLPHGVGASLLASAPLSVRLIDLSADFRLRDASAYQKWYQSVHPAPQLLATAVYGLSEWRSDEIAAARLVANPGCYPTAALLALAPLAAAGLIELQDIIIDAKSGVSGAGRAEGRRFSFCERHDSMEAYAVGGHRHQPEIEQALGAGARVVFTPHLAAMSRAILATLYVRAAAGAAGGGSPAGGAGAADRLRGALLEAYRDAPFVRVLPAGHWPSSAHVRGSNHCLIALGDAGGGRVVIVSVIDNLVKGAAGQAVQNMNIMFARRQTEGLEQAPLFP